MRKPGLGYAKTKLRDNHAADQRLCFRYIDSTIPLPSKSEISSLYFYPLNGCTVWLVSDLVGNPKDRFYRVYAHLFESFI